MTEYVEQIELPEYPGYRARIGHDDFADSPGTWDECWGQAATYGRWRWGWVDTQSGPHYADTVKAAQEHFGFPYGNESFERYLRIFHDLLVGEVPVYGDSYLVFTERSEGETVEQWEARHKGNVETWSQYLNNEVYYYCVSKSTTCACCGHVEWEAVESCGGFYGIEAAIEEAESVIKCEATKEDK